MEEPGDIRDVMSAGRLTRKLDGRQEIALIIKTMMKYGMDVWKRKGTVRNDENSARL